MGFRSYPRQRSKGRKKIVWYKLLHDSVIGSVHRLVKIVGSKNDYMGLAASLTPGGVPPYSLQNQVLMGLTFLPCQKSQISHLRYLTFCVCEHNDLATKVRLRSAQRVSWGEWVPVTAELRCPSPLPFPCYVLLG